jgi:hypothetical protein
MHNFGTPQIVAGDREAIATSIATTTYRRFDAQLIYTSHTKRRLALLPFAPTLHALPLQQ